MLNLSVPGSDGKKIHWNLGASSLVAHALRREEGKLSEHGAFIATTGVHTGRSVKDKFIVDEPETTEDVWWGAVNQPLSLDSFLKLEGDVEAFLEAQDELFVQDLYAGADPDYQIKVRVVSTSAWHALFIRNMLIRPAASELGDFVPDLTILHAPALETSPAKHGVRSETTIALSFARKTVLIAGTEYAGEIKKSVFTYMNWLLPEKGVFPMHCSANVAESGEVAVFFGLSGTGKTTLSSDPSRPLIGDDEHGWSSAGVFNIEGGCYAKVINLDRAAEPAIWDATHRFGTVLENVVSDDSGALDLDDGSLTENTRACYPTDFIENTVTEGKAGLPKNVVMLTADAFGVLPPISRLTPEQALEWFLAGYTAKVAGTEKGLGKEPQATFSTCFGAPFLPRPPQVYGEMLKALIKTHGASCWLVNTGWSGGVYGVGKRISIAHSRAVLKAALDGSLDGVEFHTEPYFGLSVPSQVTGVPSEILDPASSWSDRGAYDKTASALRGSFEKNKAETL